MLILKQNCLSLALCSKRVLRETKNLVLKYYFIMFLFFFWGGTSVLLSDSWFLANRWIIRSLYNEINRSNVRFSGRTYQWSFLLEIEFICSLLSSLISHSLDYKFCHCYLLFKMNTVYCTLHFSFSKFRLN